MALVLTSTPAPHVAQITLSDSATRNAMSEKMAEEFRRCVDDLACDVSIRAVILTGAGGAFSAGGHLDMLSEKIKLSREQNVEGMLAFYQSFLSIRHIPVPVIAALNGHAIGAALGLSLACDIRIANCDAKMGMNFVHLGLHPGMGATHYLPHLVGYARAAELLFSGAIITGAEAHSIGLVQRSVPADRVVDESIELAAKITSAGPQAVRVLKRSMRAEKTHGYGDESKLEAALQREAEAQADNYASEEFLEGISAAREKRTPQFV